MSALSQYLIFSLDNQKSAIPLFEVKRVVRVVAVTAVPGAPNTILGVVNVQGAVIPVVNIRRKFGLPQQDVNLNDRLIIMQTATQDIAFIADEVHGVIQPLPQALIAREEISANLSHLSGGIKHQHEIIFIHSPAHIFSAKDELWLQETV